MNKPIVFRVDQGEYHPVFCCKQLTVSDDANTLSAYVDISDKEGDDKAQAMYKMKVDALAEWAVPFPSGVMNGDGKKLKRPDDVLDSADAVQKFFSEFDADKDWISEVAFSSVRQNCQPKVSFFTVSLP